ncbi:hypothetical protein EVAR_37446_1 [Eumeta japonica]|uniref:Uncharacterized protein n=1 Tax=Eumeta variegata TaxID=151549 RepID=A0A4C1X4J4_EUMVA|nr:hypothetical protein EVAR_37446_1 [Eumeta japonica]
MGIRAATGQRCKNLLTLDNYLVFEICSRWVSEKVKESMKIHRREGTRCALTSHEFQSCSSNRLLQQLIPCDVNYSMRAQAQYPFPPCCVSFQLVSFGRGRDGCVDTADKCGMHRLTSVGRPS